MNEQERVEHRISKDKPGGEKHPRELGDRGSTVFAEQIGWLLHGGQADYSASMSGLLHCSRMF